MKKFMYVLLLALGVVIMMTPPVVAQEEKPFTLHGEVRFRGEYDNNTQDLNDDTDDGGLFWPYRVRIAAEGKFAKNITAWIEFQNAGVAGNESPFRTGSDEFNDTGVSAELYQGNINIGHLWSDKFNVRIGRQEIVAGNELLLGDLDFYAGLSHDGLAGSWNFKKWNLMVWYTRPLEDSVSTLDAAFLPPDQLFLGPGNTIHFWGGYANWTIHKDQTIDVYLMDVAERSTTGSFSDGFNFQTIGARYAHDNPAKKGLFWNVEYAVQAGDADHVAGTAIDASGKVGEGWIGWNFKAGKNTHRVYGRLEMATGDKASSPDKDEGFIPLFGDFHNRTGRGDWFQLSDTTTGLAGGVAGGLTATGIGYTGNFGDKSEFGAQAWKYTLDQKVGGDDDLGSALDVWYGYNYSRNLNFVASLSQLNPGNVLETAAGGVSDSVTRLYAQARLRF